MTSSDNEGNMGLSENFNYSFDQPRTRGLQQNINGNYYSRAYLQDSQDLFGESQFDFGVSSPTRMDMNQMDMFCVGSHDIALGPQINIAQNDGNVLRDSISSDLDTQLMYTMMAGADDFGNNLLLESEDFNFQTSVKDERSTIEKIIENETICFSDFRGRFEFEVKPAEFAGKRSVYDVENNKFYCDTGVYEFEIRMKFDELPHPENKVVRAVLVFTETEHEEKPVTKCLNCLETQKKLFVDHTVVPVHHVMRGHLGDPNVSYATSPKSGRLYMIMHLRAPEPGSSVLPQKLYFTCRTSCKSDETLGMNRRATAIIFSLLDDGKLIGRSIVHLRVCSAPTRDFKNEKIEKSGKSVPAKPKNRKRKAEPDTVLKPKDEQVERENLEEKKPSIGEFKEIANNSVNYYSSQESSSQETSYECEEEIKGIKVQRLLKDCRHLLSWLNSKSAEKHDPAAQLYSCLKLARKICNCNKELIEEARVRKENQNEKEKKKK